MKHKRGRALGPLSLITVWLLVVGAGSQAQEKPTVKIPQPGVPEILTMEGAYVRAAYNNEGYVILGYRVANQSIGEEWMLLEVGTTVREGTRNYRLTRDKVSLTTPDDKTIPLATNMEYRQQSLDALENRAKVVRDSINYFPPSARQACRIGFFAELSSPTMAYDQVELSDQRACLGRFYFKIPDGIQYGQHWLNVQFQASLIRVPFRILTKEEDQLLSKNYKSINQQVKDAFRKKT